jgi:hypothetical protein
MEKSKMKVNLKEKVDPLEGIQVGIRAPRGTKLTCKSWQTKRPCGC